MSVSLSYSKKDLQTSMESCFGQFVIDVIESIEYHRKGLSDTEVNNLGYELHEWLKTNIDGVKVPTKENKQP